MKHSDTLKYQEEMLCLSGPSGFSRTDEISDGLEKRDHCLQGHGVSVMKMSRKVKLSESF